MTIRTLTALAFFSIIGPLAGQAPADRRSNTYTTRCASCHAPTLRGSSHGPELVGASFMQAWSGKPNDLAAFIRARMPPGEAGTLSVQDASDLAAFILSANGGANVQAPAPVPASTPKPAAGAPTTSQARTVQNFSSVTDAMLASPPPGDWLSWRRTLDGQGYSPLSQIDRGNVSNLHLAWALSMKEGNNQATPLVHDGVMYLVHPQNTVQAVNALTGDVIWEYAYRYPADSMTLGGPTRNIAIYKDRLFLTTYDAALVAIDARTGKELWKTVKADYKKGFTHTSGPIVADGVVVSGINGCERFKKEGCFITGHDPDTGAELWRTQTIAQPDDPNNNTWGNVPPELRAGADAWIPGSYDPQLKLFYIGTAQAKPWVAASRGMSVKDAALYTNSTLALDPKTGKLAWFFQHVPGESLDMDVVFERVLLTVDSQPVVMTVGKDGILWKLDRRTGKYIDLTETVYQDVYDRVDRVRGAVQYRAEILEAKVGQVVAACPGTMGGHDWTASAYSPGTRALIIPLQQGCSRMVGGKVELTDGGGGYGMGRGGGFFEMPRANGMVGRLAAFDVKTMKELWNVTQRPAFQTGALTTAGGLVFVGDADRYFRAYDVRTGKQLWQTRLGAPVQGFPVTYTAGGKQFVAVPTGVGIFKAFNAALTPEIYQPSGGSGLYVFELSK